MYLVPSRQPYIVKYGGARVKAGSQTAKQYSLTAGGCPIICKLRSFASCGFHTYKIVYTHQAEGHTVKSLPPLPSPHSKSNS
ncbi:hypothetical protein SeMB42_g02543 [Synchytrium endobioticum]|uniref:Uncharacterized protein n=1 Tax=Synchytrium endobioticum TaxID=286115 RepID=A0A507DD72_9FUNG|nr:hypothetical protein SeMB42_g02543 [Synchytrium endobioticum]